ncbi:amidase [Paraburkholderia flagellata]|uniref:amidase n=1 Tax=Paraburkholderia flagellata TaxID=2883241 RepID=UPI001F2BB602|nr:amidase [Paraburkholderia flagellata]
MLPRELSIGEAAAALGRREFSALELAQSCLDRIAAREPEVGAWTWLDPEAVLAQARACDAREPAGPLHGIPFGIKDIIDTADMPTGYGSPIYAGHRPPMDASCVALLKRAGAVIVGKTVTTEFAFFKAGKTRNPHNPMHTPGGSSSGSAAAVADCMVHGALGSQTAGSLIRPASYCGVVGYKPTWGDFDLTGVKGLAHSLDTLGVLTRSVADAALLRDVLMAREPQRLEPDAHWRPSIGLCRTPTWLEASSATRDALEKLMLTLAQLGARVGEAVLPENFDGFVEIQRRLMAFEVSRSLAPEKRAHAQQLSEPIRQLIELGEAIGADDYLSAKSTAEQGVGEIETLFDTWDVLIAPCAPGEAPRAIEGTGDPVFSRLWMLLGVPSLALPALTGPGGLPVGVQLIGPRFGDERLLRAARWLERALH